MKRFKRAVCLIIAGLVLIVAQSLADETFPATLPERIVLNLTPTPYTSQAVTWRTQTRSKAPGAQVVRASEWMNPDHTPPQILPALTTAVHIDTQTIVYHHSVVLESLEPGTRYAYRVGDDPQWSEWNLFRTASKKSEPFTFLYFGDVQKQIFSMGSGVLRTAFQTEPESRFWLFAGDMVNNGLDDGEWNAFFSALGWISKTIPLVLVPGNHEYPDWRRVSQEDYQISSLWRPQFTLPENGPPGLEETAFSFEYQGVFFVVLNGTEQMEKQAAWLEKILAKNRQQWTIAAIHQPVYSLWDRRKKPDKRKFQELLVPLFDRFSVTLVLQGHDHGYSRSFPLKNHVRVSEGEKGTVYVVSNAGPKAYPLDHPYGHLMAKTRNGGMMFQSIRIGDKSLEFNAYTPTLEKIDTFTIQR